MTNMMCADDIVVRFDASNLVSVELGNVLGVQASRTQSSFVVELGKKLLHSAREGDTTVVLDLMGKGAPFTTDWLGTSPLHLAAMNDHVSTCDVLLRAGISRDTRTKVERTPLHLAAYEGHARVCSLLLQHGADVDCRDMLKMTPLHWAVEKGHEGCVDYLLEYGADPKSVSKFRKTPISIAVEMKRHDLVKKLKNALLNKINNEQLKDTLKATESIAVQNESEPNEILLDHTNYEDNAHMMEIEDESTEKPAEVEPHTVLENLLPQEVDEASNAATVQLLRQHGITMLPADNSNTVISALQSGRTIVLSDAGKLMLKDTSVPNNIQKPIQIKKNPVILQTAKLKNPPLSQGKVKIYTLNSNQFVAMTNPRGVTNVNNTKVSHKVPIDTLKRAVANAGINFVQIPKINVSPQKPTFQLKSMTPAKTLNNTMQANKKSAVLNISQLQNLQKDGIIHLKNATGLPSGVKIVMNKSNLGKIISSVNNRVQMINVNDIKLKKTSMANATTENNNMATKFSLNLDRERSKNLEQLKSDLVSAQKEIAEQKQLIQDKNKEIEALKQRLLLYESQCMD